MKTVFIFSLYMNKKVKMNLPVTFPLVGRKTNLFQRLNNLFLLDLLTEDGVKEQRGGTVVDQAGRLLQSLQICPLQRQPRLLKWWKYETASGMTVIEKTTATSKMTPGWTFSRRSAFKWQPTGSLACLLHWTRLLAWQPPLRLHTSCWMCSSKKPCGWQLKYQICKFNATV